MSGNSCTWGGNETANMPLLHLTSTLPCLFGTETDDQGTTWGEGRSEADSLEPITKSYSLGAGRCCAETTEVAEWCA